MMDKREYAIAKAQIAKDIVVTLLSEAYLTKIEKHDALLLDTAKSAFCEIYNQISETLDND